MAHRVLTGWVSEYIYRDFQELFISWLVIGSSGLLSCGMVGYVFKGKTRKELQMSNKSTTANDIEEAAVEVAAVRSEIANISSGVSSLGLNDVIYSGPMDSFSDKLALLADMNTSIKFSEFISKHPGEIINLTNYAVQRVDLTDDETGEVTAAPRVFLMGTTDNGDSVVLSTISRGVLNSIGQIGALLGVPSSWPEPLPVRPAQIEGRGGNRIFTLVPVVR